MVRKIFLVLIAFVVLLLIFHLLIGRNLHLLGYENGSYHVHDSIYYFVSTKAFWLDGRMDIYEAEVQMKAFSELLGERVEHAMPLGISPISFILFLPFALILSIDVSLAYSGWVMFSVFCLYFSLCLLSRRLKSSGRVLTANDYALLVVTLISFPALSGLYLGQTTVFAVAVFSVLLLFCFELRMKVDSPRVISPVLCLVVLAMKPHYFVLGAALLFVFAMESIGINPPRSKPVWFFKLIGLFALIVGIVAWLLPQELLRGYVAALKFFSARDLPSYYQWGFVPKTMNIFRYAVEPLLGETGALQATTIIFVVFSLLIVGLFLWSQVGVQRKRYINAPQAFWLLLGAYLLFSPYVAGYEDFLLILGPLLYLVSGRDYENRKQLFIVMLLLILVLNHYVLQSFRAPLVFWLLKLSLIGGFYYLLIGPRKDFNH